jgi:hypothetical protein
MAGIVGTRATGREDRHRGAGPLWGITLVAEFERWRCVMLRLAALSLVT